MHVIESEGNSCIAFLLIRNKYYNGDILREVQPHQPTTCFEGIRQTA